MLQRVVLFVLAAALSTAFVAPAFAGEKIEGDGYSIRLPDGFKHSLSIEGQGQFKVTSRFGNLPTDGVPEMKAYTYGSEVNPEGLVMLARIDLKRSITTSDELGLGDVEAMRDQLPEGVIVKARKIGEYNAIEMGIENDLMDEEQTVKVLSVACGDYVVVVMLMSMGEGLPAPEIVWEAMVGSLKIEPGMNKVLLYGGVGLGAFVLLILFRRLRSRDTGSKYSPRLSQMQPRGEEPLGHLARGVSAPPQALPSRPGLTNPMSNATAAPPGFAATPSEGRPASPPMAPVHAGAPAGSDEAPKRSGLRSTLPASGRWGQ